eukprot:CAMPEP_0113937408 /NCGR_PEP_ID=MMETSP1339-20121228/4038_1 /TAXON_ID=94617 /ORGANISM="Fibrocapsa japonica" /LENGTH=120 /DNA_ID=CAMNT_0000940159 /DNA_START=147 /DNA_END=507 /DNA_ORIENTATION=+ /assembly_acc=CAM_ASM_000762
MTAFQKPMTRADHFTGILSQGVGVLLEGKADVPVLPSWGETGVGIQDRVEEIDLVLGDGEEDGEVDDRQEVLVGLQTRGRHGGVGKAALGTGAWAVAGGGGAVVEACQAWERPRVGLVGT